MTAASAPAGTARRPQPGRTAAVTAAITLAGLGAAGTSVALAGTGRLDPHGMIVIPALHDAAGDQPARPPHDVGGALCAAAIFAAGLIAITVRGARESAS